MPGFTLSCQTGILAAFVHLSVLFMLASGSRSGKNLDASRKTSDVAPRLTRQSGTAAGQNPLMGLAGLGAALNNLPLLLQLLGGGGGLGGLMGLQGQGGASEEAGHGGGMGMGHFGAARERRATGPFGNNNGFLQQNFNNEQQPSFNSLKSAPFFNNNNFNNNNQNNGGGFPPTFFRSHERRPNFSSFAAGLSSNAGILMAPQRFPDPKFIPETSNLNSNRNFISANPQLTLSFQTAKQNTGEQQVGCIAKDSGVPIFG